MASEVGVYDTEYQNIVHKGRLKPGRMLLVDTKEKLYIKDEELKLHIARSRPYKVWLQEQVTMDELRDAHTGPLTYGSESTQINGEVSGAKGDNGNGVEYQVTADRRLGMYGYTVETINLLMLPMIKTK